MAAFNIPGVEQLDLQPDELQLNMNLGTAVTAADAGPDQQNFEVKHSAVIEMFPDLDLTQVFTDYGQMSSDALVGYIIDNIGRIPKKKKNLKRKASSPPPEEEDEPLEEMLSDLSDFEESDDDLLLSRLIMELLQVLKHELSKPPPQHYMLHRDMMEYFMKEKFPTVRADFVKTMVRQFEGRLVPASIACFLAEHRYGGKVQKYVPNVSSASFWMQQVDPINKPRPSKAFKRDFDETAFKDYYRFEKLLETFRCKYPSLLQEKILKLTKEAYTLKAEETSNERRLDCLVCFESYAVSRMLFCSSTTDQPLKDPDQPCSSKAALANEEFAIHSFCRSCVRGHAKAATNEMPLADGGVGLKCMAHECKNAILYAEIRNIISKNVRKKLDDRIMEENLGLANLENLERCKNCNFAIEMDVPTSVVKVFECFQCDAKFCRLCERPWDDEHFGISCEELDTKQKKDKKQRELEKKMNEAIIRKCPRCNVPFIKTEGCNKMTCRCGMTQCYLCRKTQINYSHFCEHFRDPHVNAGKCDKCDKPCLLWEDSNKRDERILKEIENEVENGDGQNGPKNGDAAEAGTNAQARTPSPRPRQIASPNMFLNALLNNLDMPAGRLRIPRPPSPVHRFGFPDPLGDVGFGWARNPPRTPPRLPRQATPPQEAMNRLRDALNDAQARMNALQQQNPFANNVLLPQPQPPMMDPMANLPPNFGYPPPPPPIYAPPMMPYPMHNAWDPLPFGNMNYDPPAYGLLQQPGPRKPPFEACQICHRQIPSDNRRCPYCLMQRRPNFVSNQNNGNDNQADAGDPIPRAPSPVPWRRPMLNNPQGFVLEMLPLAPIPAPSKPSTKPHVRITDPLRRERDPDVIEPISSDEEESFDEDDSDDEIFVVKEVRKKPSRSARTRPFVPKIELESDARNNESISHDPRIRSLMPHRRINPHLTVSHQQKISKMRQRLNEWKLQQGKRLDRLIDQDEQNMNEAMVAQHGNQNETVARNPQSDVRSTSKEPESVEKEQRCKEIDKLFDRIRNEIDIGGLKDQILPETGLKSCDLLNIRDVQNLLDEIRDENAALTQEKEPQNDLDIPAPPYKLIGITKNQRRLEKLRQEDAERRLHAEIQRTLTEMAQNDDPSMPGPSSRIISQPKRLDDLLNQLAQSTSQQEDSAEVPSTSSATAATAVAVIKKSPDPRLSTAAQEFMEDLEKIEQIRKENEAFIQLQNLQEIQKRQNLIASAIFENELAINRMLVPNQKKENDEDSFMEKLRVLREKMERQHDEALTTAGEIRRLVAEAIKNQPKRKNDEEEDPDEPEFLDYVMGENPKPKPRNLVKPMPKRDPDDDLIVLSSDEESDKPRGAPSRVQQENMYMTVSFYEENRQENSSASQSSGDETMPQVESNSSVSSQDDETEESIDMTDEGESSNMQDSQASASNDQSSSSSQNQPVVLKAGRNRRKGIPKSGQSSSQ